MEAPETEVAVRADRLVRELAGRGAQAAIITEPEHIFYLTGAEIDDQAILVFSSAGSALVSTAEGTGTLPNWVEQWIYDPYANTRSGEHGACFRGVAQAANRALTGRSGKALIASEWVPSWLAEGATVALDLMPTLTRAKSSWEVSVIEANLAGNDAAFSAVARRLSRGDSDYDVLDWCVSEMTRAAGRAVSWEGNIGLGAAAVLPNAEPCGAVAEPGSVAFVDLYPRRHGYAGDSTRSFYVDRAPDWAETAHERLERSLETVAGLLRPGAIAGDLDAACRQSVLEHAHDDGRFPHHTGHGIGLFATERPFLVPKSRDVVREGDVVAVEPGLYFPGRGGLRLEDVFVIESDGSRRLTRYPLALTGAT